MKRYRLLTTIFLVIFLAGGSFHFLKKAPSESPSAGKEDETLKIVLPEAQSFSRKDTPFPYYKAYRNSARTDQDLIGFAFMTADIAPEIVGYAGPIKMLVGMTSEGHITKVHIIAHSETTSYTSKLGAFLEQFTAKGINDPFELGKDIDGISRATMTSRAITRAVGKSLKEAGRQILQLEATELAAAKKTFPIEEILMPLFLFLLAIAGILSHRQYLRWLALTGGLFYFGILKGTMMSAVQIVNIGLLKFPSFEQNPLWYMLIGLTLLSTFLLGMVFCGSLCPFAAVEEILYKLTHPGKKIRARHLSDALDQKTRYAKYIILFAVVGLSMFLGNSSAAGIEPFLTLFSLKATPLGWGLLVFMLILAFFHFRFWCKYLCPVGACLGLFARFSLYKVRLGKNCTQCGACEKICPTRAIHLDENGIPKIDDPECILCGKCVNICPKESMRTKHPSDKDEQ